MVLRSPQRVGPFRAGKRSAASAGPGGAAAPAWLAS